MKTTAKHFMIWCLGWGFIILGTVGLFLPILQGILFLLVGLYLLSTRSPWAEKLLIKTRARFPRLSGKFDDAKAKVKEMRSRVFAKKEQAARPSEAVKEKH